MPSEFELIDRYFRRPALREDVLLGIGDDAALVQPPAGSELALSVDTLLEGVHFPAATGPVAIGHKALAVNLSDLGAMGADPAWATLALSLPQPDEAWLEGFCTGWFALAQSHRVELIGGDTTRGPLGITVQVVGTVPQGQALRRSGARPGDRIYVTGTLGDAAVALEALSGRLPLGEPGERACRRRLEFPEPRIGAGVALRGLGTAAIDISDGLLADLGHLLQASGGGARVELEDLPLSATVAGLVRDGRIDPALPLQGGDDYELLFTVPEQAEAELRRRWRTQRCRLSRIGRIESQTGLRLYRHGIPQAVPPRGGYEHFRD